LAMLQRALAAGVPFAWMTGDSVYVRRPVKMNGLSGPTRTGCTAQIERAVR
jgi:hypothetical protein